MDKYIEVMISSVRVGLMSQNRVILLKDSQDDRYLPIWVDPNQAELITLALQEIQTARPLTHDLLKNIVRQLNARLIRVEIVSVEKEVFYSRLVLEIQNVEKERIMIDCRPSDAIAIAVRMNGRIYVSDDVMQVASIVPNEDLLEINQSLLNETRINLNFDSSKEDDQDSNKGGEDLSLFDDFIDNMDL